MFKYKLLKEFIYKILGREVRSLVFRREKPDKIEELLPATHWIIRDEGQSQIRTCDPETFDWMYESASS